MAAPGKVYLNPELLKDMPPYAALSLLIHETRHSAQLQLVQSQQGELAKGSFAAFQAQKNLSIRTFCDFLTLNNEYEAFQFSNYVLGKLSGWKIRLEDMGTLASQFDEHGHSIIDLEQLSQTNLLNIFNELEQTQCEQLGICSNENSEE